MKKLLFITGVLACVGLVSSFFISKSSKDSTEEILTAITIFLEQAYFEGQKDALEGDIRIKQTEEGWMWIKSPWDEGQAPIYDPKKDN